MPAQGLLVLPGLPRAETTSAKLSVDPLRMATRNKPTHEDSQWELVLFGIGLEIRAHCREVIVAGQRMLCHTKQIVLAWVGVSFRQG